MPLNRRHFRHSLRGLGDIPQGACFIRLQVSFVEV
jgi:hypothetical protein